MKQRRSDKRVAPAFRLPLGEGAPVRGRMRGRSSTTTRFRQKKGRATWPPPHPSRLAPSHLLPTPFVPLGHFPLIGGTGPRGRLFTAAPRDCCQTRRVFKQGKRKAHTTHRRAAAGGERSTTTSLHPRRSIFRQASLPDGSPGSGPAGPALGPRTEPSEAGQCGRRRGKGMQQGIPCQQGVPCGMDFDPMSGTFLRGKVPRPQAKHPHVPQRAKNR